MTRFWIVATVVAAAVALLIVGAASGDLTLVYVSIGLAALALVLLIIGVAVWRDRVFGGPARAGTAAGPRLPPAPQQPAVQQPAVQQPAAPQPAAPGWPDGPPAGQARGAAAAVPDAGETLVPAGPARPAGAPAPARAPAVAVGSAAGAGAAPLDTPAPAPEPDAEVLIVPGIARYHRPGCMLIRFLGEEDLERSSRADAEAAGGVACRACKP